MFAAGWWLFSRVPPEKTPPWAEITPPPSHRTTAKRLKIAGLSVAILIPLFLALTCMGLAPLPSSWPSQLQRDSVFNAVLALALLAAGLYLLGWHFGREEDRRRQRQSPGQPEWRELPRDEHLPYR
jgi:hypothetical protein